MASRSGSSGTGVSAELDSSAIAGSIGIASADAIIGFGAIFGTGGGAAGAESAPFPFTGAPTVFALSS
ncbi:hypothetical protein D3C83_219490 [compost metagenome]